ncbi:glycosyltransferase [Robinsoniella peoriensis]|uniref:Beta-1,6-galactofuranosyltransferase n=1 Tax=Robinsoniella peoriensis TaxID=180332 RepID=A0A4U8Q8V5_9FIRM|nr:glycosyltransferase family 4 protein [Robinsoniella peoriensis]MDU7028126.1 glycosyltransferase [Clostridiales bacterium]TLD01351.1 beta-1,6-galactofuranosyltransferase [Robinsoniella peoriensis]
MKVLYITAAAPYDTVGHAGGQTLNYYAKKMSEQIENEISLVAYCTPNDLSKIDLSKYGINFIPVIKKDGLTNFIGNVFSIWSKINPLHKFGNIMTRNASQLLLHKLQEIASHGYNPDVIIMEWTQIVLQVQYIKKIFPNSAIVASEHDVTFLGIMRQAGLEKNRIIKTYKLIRAYNMKKRELAALNKCDLIFTHNNKDDDLLKNEGIRIDKRKTLVPFYHQSVIPRKRCNNDIIFYGNMKRKENYLAAFWFIDNVMPLLEHLPIRFVVVGGGPTDELKSKECKRIHITGFVNEIDPYFAYSLCFVAPLQLGAGIKVKVIEAMYTDIPVLTNDIGIEGIPAQATKDYFHCNTPEEYVNVIEKLLENQSGYNITTGKNLINKEFSFEKSFQNYYRIICATVKEYK